MTAVEQPGEVRQRSTSIDRVRGLAVVCMIVDHVCVVMAVVAGVGGPLWLLRMTIGRVAMPLFFVTAGRCSGRLRARHALVAFLGLLLPVVVPFLDAPNVLLWWAWGSVALAACRWAEISPAVLGIVCLGVLANDRSGDWSVGGSVSYDPYALMGLMALGAVLPVSWWAWGDKLAGGRLLGWLGRHALPVYVVHVLAFTVPYVALR